jgi:hypothetical protein
MQAACRKDVEQAFEVSQSRFAIVQGPPKFWDEKTFERIMAAAIIMHNMIFEDGRG